MPVIVLAAEDALVAMRVVVGIFWILNGTSHMKRDVIALIGRLSSREGVPRWFKHLLDNAILSHPHFFGKAIPASMILCGLSLVFGVAATIAASVMTFYAINIALAKPSNPGAGEELLLLVALQLLVIVSGASRLSALIPF